MGVVNNNNKLIVLPIIILLVSVIIISLLSISVFSSVENIKPTSFSDDKGFSSNETHAYDSDSLSFTKMVSGDNNVSYYSLGTGSHPDTEDILNATITLTINSSGFSNDEWGLSYSNNSGTSWISLRALSSDNLPTQNLTYTILDDGGWLWSELATDFRVKIQTINISNEKAITRVFDIFVKVTYDGEGPEINLSEPIDNMKFSKATLVNFSFNASDDFSGIKNCSLIINDVINKTNSSISSVQNIFDVLLDDGFYSWKIICYDNSSNYNSKESILRNLYVDNSPPLINLLNPGNDTVIDTNTVHFSFNVTDVSNMSSCSLYINNSFNKSKNSSNLNWPTGIEEIISYIPDGNYSWYVNCSDIYGRSNISKSFLLNVFSNKAPFFSDIGISPYTNLVLAGNKTVFCNGTVTDPNGWVSLSEVNAYFHREDYPYNGSDSVGVHFTNSSCNVLGINTTSREYDCSFVVPYYSASMNWRCTFEAKDNEDFIGEDYNTTFINPIYSFNVNPNYVSYGLIDPGEVSKEKSITVVNLGNTELDLALTGYSISEGDGLALDCVVGNTSLSNERYSTVQNEAYINMTSLISSVSYLNLPQIDKFNLPPRNASFNGEKDLYWKIKLGIPQKGDCQGYLTFVAIQS